RDLRVLPDDLQDVLHARDAAVVDERADLGRLPDAGAGDVRDARILLVPGVAVPAASRGVRVGVSEAHPDAADAAANAGAAAAHGSESCGEYSPAPAGRCARPRGEGH